jgi:hypothetical protein
VEDKVGEGIGKLVRKGGAWHQVPVRLPFGILGALILLGCEHRAHPWDQPDAGDLPPSQPPPPLVALPRFDGGSAPGLDAAEPDTPSPPVRVGGPWVRCYGGFHPSGEPVKDVTRLSLLCGPENGMKRLSKKALEGSVAAGGPAVAETFEARRGECYRIFAVAEPIQDAGTGVADLDVVVRSSRGPAIAADHGEDPWPIVQPDRPFCALEDDRYTVEVSARRGSGHFAAEVWVLHTRAPEANGPR